MIVRLGYVAMSMRVKNASPSKTMTFTSFSKLDNREAAVRKLERIAAENIHNTLRLLRHNRAHDIELYRCSSRLIPLVGHEQLGGWYPIQELTEAFAELGGYAKEHRMRLSFHPDHFTVLSTPREEVLRSSQADLERHVRMLEAMGLDSSAKCNIHIGGTYGNKESARQRFVNNFTALSQRIKERMTLENDDKTFNALETLEVCEEVGVPMVLDIHHDQVNPSGEPAEAHWSRIQSTWAGYKEQAGFTKPSAAPRELPPKIHVSSPKSDKDPRGHADYIEPSLLMSFLRAVAPITPRLDVMLEAKRKDDALFELMKSVRRESGVTVLSQASFEL
ncbi:MULTISPECIES: UV DNA damage repair endonuclease UvsE [unclassified Paenibacillus]|uniref:UV DNA damage repair endonuclease UvsE n=1 Tax=unclassified Paenibacillus TaxID=185978 RepID=UPI001AE752F5|nr:MULTISPECIES: UV DNA damage repair endonuclease UvsE [unclassified Paenibacillus]MBP1157524.1 UV DNA damage endonuclease [Paenibacillus sp. PvP091]MBP1171739.1 UV DNA damage endonuclease [Paenibacillus sp. PvR098]MBP2438120.1 UV DNA damage endonuclease [Paenibacillus sp. PvP052]